MKIRKVYGRNNIRLLVLWLLSAGIKRQKVGTHGQRYHEQEVHDLSVTELQADEQHGFTGSKVQPAWEAELLDIHS